MLPFGVDTNTNRFTDTSFHYDKNGNVVQDVDSLTSQNRTFTFNGDNKQINVKNANGDPVGQYFYDGEGKRVKKVTNTETTVFVYSSGKLIAEYSTQIASQGHTNYTTTDHLGSPRVITDELGQVKSRQDFMPFGEDLFAGIGNRTGETGLKYSVSGADLRQKFTGYQKDTETDLDFAEARMYENRFGRFTAVDPMLASGKSANPQTFNRYVYVGNNPIVTTDPSGLDWYKKASSNSTRQWDYKWYADDPGGDWKAVDFGSFSNVYSRVDNAYDGDTSLGTVYLNRYGNNYLSQSEYDKVAQQHGMFESGGGCFANPQCSGVRDPIHDGQSIGAFSEFTGGNRIGFSNEAKASIDPTLVDLSLIIPGSSLHNMFGVPTVFNYETPKPGLEALGSSTGSVAFNLLSALATERIGSRLASSTAPAKTGYYLLEFESGNFYAGKGPIERMKQSASRLSFEYKDPVVQSRFFPASSNQEAFLGEHRLMMDKGGPIKFDLESPTYNRIFSPGRRFEQ